MCVGLITAVPSEGFYFAKRLREVRTSPGFRPSFYRGKLEGKEVIYSVSGMGKTNAAHAATVLIRDYSPELLINFGAGGAYPSAGLAVGDVAVAEAEIYGDEGVLDSKGFHGADYIGIPLLERGRKKFYNEFALEGSLAEAAVRSAGRAIEEMAGSPKVRSGRFVTVSTCTGTRKRAAEVRELWDAICENMEGAAIAHICALYKIPFLELRGVSNIVEDRDTGKWNLKLASENCCKAVVQLLKELADRSTGQ
ncbi:MAG: futalosine hydrolase [Candidatus Sulfobium sp.]